jgi:hypothetical protein
MVYTPLFMCFRFAVLFGASTSMGAVVGLAGCGGPVFTASATTTDGGGSGGADASTGTDAGPGFFCSPDAGYDFCSDFDQKPLPESWNNDNTSGGGSGTEDNGESVSPPNSFLATAPALVPTQGPARAILTALGLPKGQTHLAFDLRIDDLTFPNPLDPNASVVPIAYTQGQSYTLALDLHPATSTGASFAAGLLETTPGDAGGPPLKLTPLTGVLTSVGVWYHVAIDFTIDQATNPGAVPASVAVTSGSPPATVTKLVTLSPPTGTALGARTISVGVQSTATVGAAKIRIDNVTYKH